MDTFFRVVNSIIEIAFLPGRLIAKIIPFSYFLFVALSVAIVFYLTKFILDTIKKNHTVSVANANNYSGGQILKSMEMAGNVKIIYKIRKWYMVVCNIYIFTSFLYGCSIRTIMGNIFWVVIMGVASLLPILCLVGFIHDEKFITKAHITSGIAILVCKMLSDMSGLGIVSLAAILYFSFASSLAKSKYTYLLYDTKRYFGERKKAKETFVTQKADFDILTEIKDNMNFLGEFKGDKIETLSELEEMVYKRRISDKAPVCMCTNEDYYERIVTLGGYNVVSNPNDFESWNESLSRFSSYNLEKATKLNFDVNSYKKEAAEKVLCAIGYSGEATRESYVKFRQTAMLLEKFYDCKIKEQEYLWKEAYSEEFPIISSGVVGERRVFQAMQQLKERYPDMIVLENFHFEYGEKKPDSKRPTSECDMLILTCGGIYCVEVKNYGENANYIIEIDETGKWNKRYGEQLHPIDDLPFRQNETHITTLNLEFSELFKSMTNDGSELKITPLVVVPNATTIDNHSKNPEHIVLNINGLCKYITEEAKIYSMDKVRKVAETLAKRGDPASEFPHIDFVSWKKQIEALEPVRQELLRITEEIKLSEKYRIL